MIHNNFNYLLRNTNLKYPDVLNREEALLYLNCINHQEFSYNLLNQYNIVDYEKLIYIELSFKDDNEIQQLLLDIKKGICEGYLLKKQYKYRIIDMPDFDILKDINERSGYYGIPKEYR